MDIRHRERQVGGDPVHVSDCYIWAAIHYLDSPTDYREYLPGGRKKVLCPASNLVLLAERGPSVWFVALEITLIAGMACMLLPLMMRACE